MSGRLESKDTLHEALTEATRIILYNEATRIMIESGVNKFAVRDAVSFALDIAYPITSSEHIEIITKSRTAKPNVGMSGVAIPGEGQGFGVLRSIRESRVVAEASKEEKAKLKVKQYDTIITGLEKAIDNYRKESKDKRKLAELEKKDSLPKARLLNEALECDNIRMELNKDLDKARKDRTMWEEQAVEAEKKKIHFKAGESKTIAGSPKAQQEKMTLHSIRQGAASVMETKAGECNTFASFAVAKLMDEIPIKPCPTIKLVAHPDGYGGTHNFVLLGYDSPDVSLPALQANKHAFVIIDPWLAALGHGNGVYTLDEYPKPKYLPNLQCIFDSSLELTAASVPRGSPRA